MAGDDADDGDDADYRDGFADVVDDGDTDHDRNSGVSDADEVDD